MTKRKETRRVSVKSGLSVSVLGDRTAERLVVAGLLVAASVLLLANLGNIYLWSDEAQTGLVAKTVLQYGVPKGTDGTNLFSQEGGAELGRNQVWRWHAWLPFYVLAGFYAVFGVSTFTARLPFALFGIATILLTYYLGRAMWGSRRAGALAASVLIASVPFILLSRQCRYYAPSAFFSLAALYAYHQMVNRRRGAGAFLVSAFLLFHTFYIYLAALLATVIVHAAIFHRERLKQIALLSAAVAVVNIPWVVFFASAARGVHGEGSALQRLVVLAGFSGPQLAKHVFPPWLLLPPAIALAVDRLRHKPFERPSRGTTESLALLVFFAVATVLTALPAAPELYLRYFTPTIPVFALIAAKALERSMRLNWSIAVLALVILALQWRMPDYLYEITHDYDGPNEGIVLYLRDNAKADDLVVTDHDPLPIAFYTNLRVIGGVTGDDVSQTKNADWIVIRGHVTPGEFPFARYLRRTTDWENYEEILLPYPDITYENREAPDEHLFRTAEGEPPVVIYRRY
jgi:4-amino-4-deoxy-L-arabinose transferase-like glycosyltransferase